MEPGTNNSEDGVSRDTLPSESYHHTDSYKDFTMAGIGDSLDITGEPLHVRAAFLYLSGLPYQQWAYWHIGQLDRRLLAARWLAEQFDAIDAILRRETV